MALTLALFPLVETDPARFPDKVLLAPVMMVSELFVGMVIGLTVRLFFAGVQMAGLLIGFQMGFSMINVMDPQSGSQVSIMEQFGYWVVLSVFLLLNGHHILLGALVDSFAMIPMGGFAFPEVFFEHVMALTGAMFVAGIKIGAPVIVALLFVSVAFGITAKFAPQMNVLIVAFPVKIGIGLGMFGATLEITARFSKVYLADFAGRLGYILQMLGGG